jgi:hypothetical protein
MPLFLHSIQIIPRAFHSRKLEGIKRLEATAVNIQVWLTRSFFERIGGAPFLSVGGSSATRRLILRLAKLGVS